MGLAMWRAAGAAAAADTEGGEEAARAALGGARVGNAQPDSAGPGVLAVARNCHLSAFAATVLAG
jgi:hypothetical protein